MKETLGRLHHHAPLISASEISKRVEALAREISADYHGKELVAVVVLKGAFIFASDLVRYMDSDSRIEIDFVHASSYGSGTKSSGRVTLEGLDTTRVTGRHILVVEDILDTGQTLKALLARLWSMAPASVEMAVLLSKDHDGPKTAARYVGFHIPNEFVVGYGLDYGQDYRHLPDIRVLITR